MNRHQETYICKKKALLLNEAHIDKETTKIKTNRIW